MEWTASLQAAIRYIEAHLLEDFCADDVAREVYISSFYLQKGFSILTGYSLGEYIRCRRLYLAALDAISGRDKVIDLAYRYGYDTPESFTKAFTRFHGLSPLQLRSHPEKIRVFLPLKLKISIQGGNGMEYKLDNMDAFQVIGFSEIFSMDTAYSEIPRFWDRIRAAHMQPLFEGAAPATETEQAVCRCRVGELAICVDEGLGDGKYRYLIAGPYDGGPVPADMEVLRLPAHTWAKFNCTGPMPGALQAVNTKIFAEWLPAHPEYEVAEGISVEWYALGDTAAPDYESAIWVPLNKK